MLYSENPRVRYDKPQLAEVICQLRFPAILSIGAREPVDFQEAVRGMFPRYTAKEERPAAKITGLGTPGAKVETPKPVINHNFISADGHWKLNLTSSFISLSTVAYTGWESFGKQFDLPLVHFIRIYKPAFFERIGLRYVNIFSRRALELEGEPWRELIAAPYLGVLAEEDVDERSARKCSVDVELNLDSTCRAKIHGQAERAQCPPGPGGEIHSGPGPVHGRADRPTHGRRRTGNPPRTFHAPVPGGDYRQAP